MFVVTSVYNLFLTISDYVVRIIRYCERNIVYTCYLSILKIIFNK